MIFLFVPKVGQLRGRFPPQDRVETWPRHPAGGGGGGGGWRRRRGGGVAQLHLGGVAEGVVGVALETTALGRHGASSDSEDRLPQVLGYSEILFRF